MTRYAFLLVIVLLPRPVGAGAVVIPVRFGGACAIGVAGVGGSALISK